jgi:acetolactate synthase-1/2/3 large subunit
VKKNVKPHSYLSNEEDQRFPILPQRLVKITRTVLPEDGIVTLDNGGKIWFGKKLSSSVQPKIP